MAQEIRTAREAEAAEAAQKMPRILRLMLRPEDKALLDAAKPDAAVKIGANGTIKRVDLSEFSSIIEIEIDSVEVLEPQSQSEIVSDFQSRKVLGV